MSTLTVQNIQGSSSSGNTISVASGHVLQATGHILQVKQAIFRGNYTFNDASYQDIIDLTLSITPSSTSNKILAKCVLCASANANQRFGVRIVRDGSMILPPIDYNGQGGSSSSGAQDGQALGNRTLAHVFGDGGGSNIPTMPSVIELLDSPNSTSSLTYKVQAFCEAASYLYINNCQTWSDDATKFASVSTLTLMEIAG